MCVWVLLFSLLWHGWMAVYHRSPALALAMARSCDALSGRNLTIPYNCTAVAESARLPESREGPRHGGSAHARHRAHGGHVKVAAENVEPQLRGQHRDDSRLGGRRILVGLTVGQGSRRLARHDVQELAAAAEYVPGEQMVQA